MSHLWGMGCQGLKATHDIYMTVMFNEVGDRTYALHTMRRRLTPLRAATSFLS